ncbi:MAG: hypothetical protein HC836_22450 [Richelia sp. RM2_1_2]|nr:hypothetical protein [Richelia sp. SM2_1_7]NJM18773.1 hypothetical protein [Richelia sp. SM1_7_0]NJN10414.1 hypothetical protein [Richelia sp. RM1_1_1]NJO28910.1 hypothetical protein [Richelia sp. SL_2_1]NJO60911.1 hypothetical protein [Richelia sp. RM2_1_2]
MKFALTVPNISLALLSVIVSLSLVSPGLAQVKLPSGSTQVEPVQPIEPDGIDTINPTGQTSSVLSLDGGKRLMSEAGNAVSSQNYALAETKLKEARLVFNQLSNFYQQLNSSFAGIDNRVADSQRQKALSAAQMRDEATYQLALVNRAQNKPELAVPLLVQIIKSQNPSRELGQKAYQQLFELGFVDSPYPRSGGNASSPKK